MVGYEERGSLRGNVLHTLHVDAPVPRVERQTEGHEGPNEVLVVLAGPAFPPQPSGHGLARCVAPLFVRFGRGELPPPSDRAEMLAAIRQPGLGWGRARLPLGHGQTAFGRRVHRPGSPQVLIARRWRRF